MNPTDRDGKSKTASAVDQQHYPEQNEVDGNISGHPHRHTHDDDIARLAHERWMKRGGGPGSAEEDWFHAEEELRAKKNSEDALAGQLPSGSVQK